MSEHAIAGPVVVRGAERGRSQQGRIGLVAICLAVLVLGIWIQPVQAWAGVLTAGLVGLAVTLGAGVFAALNMVTGSRWWVPTRQVAVDLTSAVIVPALFLLAVAALGAGRLYPWADAEHVAHSPLLQGKTPWLNLPFFLVRTVVVLAVWLGLAVALRRVTRGAAPVGRPNPAQRRWGACFLLLFGLTASVGFWDWCMSLEPEWFSTMHGVYGFAGLLQGGVAVVAGLLVHRANRRQEPPVSDAVLHDLGKALFAFSMLWAYIWFSEFMLIWYANIPEETFHFANRMEHGWTMLFWLNPIVNFVVPFVVLLPEAPKKNPMVLHQVALLLLLGRCLDAHLMVAPAVTEGIALPVWSLAAVVAALTGIGFVLDRLLSQRERTESCRAI